MLILPNHSNSNNSLRRSWCLSAEGCSRRPKNATVAVGSNYNNNNNNNNNNINENDIINSNTNNTTTTTTNNNNNNNKCSQSGSEGTVHRLSLVHRHAM